jgi:hypothetical protein
MTWYEKPIRWTNSISNLKVGIDIDNDRTCIRIDASWAEKWLMPSLQRGSQ